MMDSALHWLLTWSSIGIAATMVLALVGLAVFGLSATGMPGDDSEDDAEFLL